MNAPSSSHHDAPALVMPRMERLLQALGADPAFTEAVLGDLAEEYAFRAAYDGVGAARVWYLREASRSAPHLAWSAVQRIVRRGSHRERIRLATLLATVVVALCGSIAAVLTRNGPPARFVTDIGDGRGTDDGIVVNSRRPVRLGMRVVDAAGHQLDRTDIRYRWMSGTPIPVSGDGVVSCPQRGDAMVRAALGALTTHFAVHCLPVRELRGATWIAMTLGDVPQQLRLQGIGVDGLPVARLATRLRVGDSTIATLDGTRIRPIGPGRTYVEAEVGEHRVRWSVVVLEPVRAFDGLRDEQQFVVAPLHVARGATVRRSLPVGLFWLTVAERPTAPVTSLVTFDGLIMCSVWPAFAPGQYRAHCLARAPGATVVISHPAHGEPEIVGTLALERDEPWAP